MKDGGLAEELAPVGGLRFERLADFGRGLALHTIATERADAELLAVCVLLDPDQRVALHIGLRNAAGE